MATVTHYIYSHYDPKDREKLEIETGQVAAEAPEADPWETVSTFSAQRRLAQAPSFVPAAISYDELNNIIGAPTHPQQPAPQPSTTSEVGGWYRSLARATAGPSSRASTAPPPASPSAPHSSGDTPQTEPSDSRQRRPERRTKNNCFIERVLRSEPASVRSSPPPTLADILAREPPPSDKQNALQPPVFLALGPANRGWTMLQRSGWNEGEGLGANVPQHADSTAGSTSRTKSKWKAVAWGSTEDVVVKQEEREIACGSDGEISEVRKVDVVDLTLSDSDEESDEEMTPAPEASSLAPSGPLESHTKPLLTPIPTILKSDRLGIGLKAKTVGPYKASKKRVTHNQAALAAHIRANEELRRMKKIVGRGSRGFARLAKADSEQRRQLLADLNSS